MTIQGWHTHANHSLPACPMGRSRHISHHNQGASRAVSFMPRIQCRQCSSRLSDSCMADLVGASIPERGAASTHQELLLRSQPLPRSPLRQYSSSSCSEAAAMAAADSLLTPLESCKNGVHSSWHQVVRQRQVSSGQQGHHRLWCGQPPSGAASAASRRPLPRGKRNVFGGSDKDVTCKEIVFYCETRQHVLLRPKS